MENDLISDSLAPVLVLEIEFWAHLLLSFYNAKYAQHTCVRRLASAFDHVTRSLVDCKILVQQGGRLDQGMVTPG